MPSCDMSLSARLCNVLTVEDAKGLLQRFNLFLATGDTVLVALTSIHAGWLELLVIGKCCVQFLLCTIKVSLGLLKSLLMILLLARLVLDVLGLLSFVDTRVRHEFVVLLLSFSLSCTSFRFKAGKIRLNDLNHTNYASILRAHTLVGFVKDFWLLHKGCGLSSFGIELLEHAEGLRNSSLCILGVFDGNCVLRFLLLANTGCIGHGGVKFCNCFGKVRDLLSELGDARFKLIDLSMECLDRLSLLLTSLLVGGELSVAPSLVLSLLVGLFHELDNEILDHLLNLLERIFFNPHGKGRQHTAV